MHTVVRIWDLPIRIFHWALVTCLIGLVITGYRGGAAMDWHARIGYVLLSLLLFRVVWGFVGGRWSRFRSFIYSPSSVWNYLRGQAHPDHLVGISPLGAASVFAMIVVLFAQVGSGLIGDDEISFTGPLNKFVQSSTALAATWYHKRVGQWLILGLVALHITAVLYYLWKTQDNLIKPMLDGNKTLDRLVVPSRDDAGSRVAALVIFGVCAGLVTGLVKLGG